MENKLPFTIDVPVKSYLHHSYPLGIIFANSKKSANNFVAHNYLQLVWFFECEYPGAQLNFDTCFFPYWKCFKRKNKRVFATQDTLIECVKKEIDNKYYIYLTCDEFYLKCRASYNKEHFIHDIMIYGYDDENRIFYIAGFDKNRKYNTNAISYDELVLPESQYIESIRFKNCSYKKINRNHFKKCMFNYLNPQKHTKKQYKKNKDKRAHGIKAAYLLEEYLLSVIKDKSKINIIPFHIYYERLCIIKWVIHELKLDEYIEKEWDLLCDNAKYIKITALKYEKYNRLHDVDEMQKLLKECINKECELLSNIIAKKYI